MGLNGTLHPKTVLLYLMRKNVQSKIAPFVLAGRASGVDCRLWGTGKSTHANTVPDATATNLDAHSTDEHTHPHRHTGSYTHIHSHPYTIALLDDRGVKNGGSREWSN